MSVTREDIVAALAKIVDPGQGKDLISAGMAKAITVSGGTVSFVIEVDPAKGAAMEPLRVAAVAAVEGLPGVEKVSAVLTAHSDTPPPSRPAAPKGPPPDLNLGGSKFKKKQFLKKTFPEKKYIFQKKNISKKIEILKNISKYRKTVI